MRKTCILLLAVLFFISCKSQPKTAELPFYIVNTANVIEPKFEVISIYIVQADLVVTEFEAVIKVKNPNQFASNLSSIKYELYGNNVFWADGAAKDILHIPADSSGEIDFYFSMNFINMSRKLLDDIINMKRVHYRFKGQADIQFDIPNVPAYTIDFDCSGLSEIKRKIEF
jgi:LEA14-like dessication related protein